MQPALLRCVGRLPMGDENLGYLAASARAMYQTMSAHTDQQLHATLPAASNPRLAPVSYGLPRWPWVSNRECRPGHHARPPTGHRCRKELDSQQWSWNRSDVGRCRLASNPGRAGAPEAAQAGLRRQQPHRPAKTARHRGRSPTVYRIDRERQPLAGPVSVAPGTNRVLLRLPGHEPVALLWGLRLRWRYH